MVALSGGVDSSVAAALLQKDGHEVEGAYMRCWSSGSYCTADKDQADAAKVARRLGIPFRVLNYEKEYKQKVIDYFFFEYASGRTPNPDVLCNKEIKFGLFLKEAERRGFDYVATGHYARIENGSGYRLFTGLDEDKDQSYFLYRLGQEELSKTIFPLGDLTKQEVRKIARKLKLPTAGKKDSTGICFVGPANIRQLLLTRIRPNRGDIVTVDGDIVGQHIGLPFYTIGQREGLGISKSIPYYVAGKDETSNRLIVAPFGHKALFKQIFTAESPNWIGGKSLSLPKQFEVKLRYRGENVKAVVEKNKSSGLIVRLEKPQKAITPGQASVFYRGSELIGGATITNVIN